MGSIDQIILSCNEDDTYSGFWIPVAQAYKKMFPNLIIHLAFLTNREDNDEIVIEFRKHGKVTLFKPVNYISEFGQAKMIRFILASEQDCDVCYIDDIDLFPLSKTFITDKTSQRPENTLLCVGGEVYHGAENSGCYPISQMTAEGYLWKRIINPSNKSYSELLEDWSKTVKYNKCENIRIELDFSKGDHFSDEKLLRRLISENPVPKFELERGYDNVLESTLDRGDWKLDLDKLNNHGYFNAHGIRPYKDYIKEYEPLINYINNNYE